MVYRYTFQQFVIEEHDSSKILEVIYSLDRQLKYLHSKGYYATSIDFQSIMKNDNNDFGFVYVEKLPKENVDLYIKGNIDSLAKISLGAFVYVASYDLGYVGDINSFNYERICRQNPDYLKQNYNFIRSSIPATDDFGDYYDAILDGKYDYFSDFVDRKSKNSQNKSSAITMVKSTAVGRAYKDDDAFIRILFYPILLVCVSVLSILVYLFILR